MLRRSSFCSNVCRHHAARICEGFGNAKALVCPYHQWTYNLEGRLTKATRLKGIEGFSAAKVHLPSYQVSTWGPLVFVNLSPANPDSTDPLQRPLNQQLAEAQAMLEENGGWEGGEVPWRSLGHVKRRVYEIGCNWKVVFLPLTSRSPARLTRSRSTRTTTLTAATTFLISTVVSTRSSTWSHTTPSSSTQ